MAYGISVYNTGGSVQVDQDYTSFALKVKSSVTLTTDPSPHPQPLSIATISFTGVSPVLALGEATFDVSVYATSNSGSSWTFYLLSPGAGPKTIDYYIFDLSSQVSSSDTWGIEVYRADGSKAFSSGTRPVAIAGVLECDADSNTSATYPAGRTYAFTCASKGVHSVQIDTDLGITDPGPGNKWMERTGYIGCGRLNSNNFYGGATQLEVVVEAVPTSTPETTTSYGKNNYWIIDVTGY